LIQFILNKKLVSTALPVGTALLDFIRYDQHLTGTKIGCREGDCGACTVLVGDLQKGRLQYRTATCCLMAIGNANGKHIVTVEGLNMDRLNPIQQALSDEGATQCGFCTPGFVVSLAGFCLSHNQPTPANAIASIDGNICRCTGYKSIQKAALKVAVLLQERTEENPLLFATQHDWLPLYFNNIQSRLKDLSGTLNGALLPKNNVPRLLGGGTDLYVQQHENMVLSDIRFLAPDNELKGIYQIDNTCVIGAAATVTDMLESPVFHHHFPRLHHFMKLVSSTPIRNMASIAGNFVNASPIGDLTIFFLALNAKLVIKKGGESREVWLRNFYKGYKIIDKESDEYVEKIWFELPAPGSLFNFEKVCKRTHLDIASVNSAVSLQIDGETIVGASLTAGGVGPLPMYLQKASMFLCGRQLSEAVVTEAVMIAMGEIVPISDARGSAAYKSLLLGQLIKAHFLTFFPALRVEKLLIG